jgi:hypothetical protein
MMQGPFQRFTIYLLVKEKGKLQAIQNAPARWIKVKLPNKMDKRKSTMGKLLFLEPLEGSLYNGKDALGRHKGKARVW